MNLTAAMPRCYSYDSPGVSDLSVTANVGGVTDIVDRLSDEAWCTLSLLANRHQNMSEGTKLELNQMQLIVTDIWLELGLT